MFGFRVSVRLRVLALSYGLLAIFGSSALILGFLIERNQAEQSTLREQYRRFEIIQALQQAVALYRHFGGQLNTAILTKDAQAEDKLRLQQQAARKDVDTQLLRLGSFDPDSEQVMTNALETVEEDSHQGLEAFIAGHEELAAPFINQVQRRLSLIENTLTEITARERGLTDRVLLEARAHARLAIQAAIVIIVLGMVGGMLLALFVVRSIVRPLRITTEAIRQVNAGQLQIDLPPVSGDEFGEVALALRQFKDGAEKLRRLAYQDPLTGLGNRAALAEHLETALAGERRDDSRLVLYYCDLDNFRAVNDRCGYKAGNQYLCEAAARLQRFIPADAELFRYEGDKFVALALQSGGAQIHHIADGVLRGLSEPYRLGSQLLNMSVSIGVAVSPEDGETAEQLISGAEAAGHAAKMSGRNNARFAGGLLTGRLRQQAALTSDIRRALEHNEFELFYQPIIDVGLRGVVAAEALVRWRHPDRGLVAPDAFIRVAEEAGLISALGEYCLRLAHGQLGKWREQGRNIRVAVNLSGRQVQDAKVLAPLAKLQQEDAAAVAMMDLELTESVLFEPSEEIRRTLDDIKKLGYRLSMDDFGTGYSSFSVLRHLPIDKIKIDRQFVGDMSTSRVSAAIISALLAIADRLDLEVVAEGVETPQQMESLLKQGCSLQQGYFFSPALPVDEFERWVDAYSSGRQAQFSDDGARPWKKV
ncbi:MAG: hypothetical protein JWR16_2681 [Nevskia sp.]|nr:hypothetical protein [Nevskia sp.]